MKGENSFPLAPLICVVFEKKDKWWRSLTESQTEKFLLRLCSTQTVRKKKLLDLEAGSSFLSFWDCKWMPWTTDYSLTFYAKSYANNVKKISLFSWLNLKKFFRAPYSVLIFQSEVNLSNIIMWESDQNKPWNLGHQHVLPPHPKPPLFMQVKKGARKWVTYKSGSCQTQLLGRHSGTDLVHPPTPSPQVKITCSARTAALLCFLWLGRQVNVGRAVVVGRWGLRKLPLFIHLALEDVCNKSVNDDTRNQSISFGLIH